MAGLGFEVILDDRNLQSKLSASERRIMGFSDKAQKEFSSIENAYKQIGAGVAGAFAFTELAQLPGKIAQVRGEFQQLEISFSTMLGSKLKADKLMTSLVDFAAKTPYGLKDTAAGAKQLLAYGETAENVTKTLTRLGDIASGIGAPLNDIVYLYGTTMTQGRLYTQDLNQFTGRGIPMIKELAKQFKVADSEVKALVESGKVGFPEVQKVIESLTAKGSMFGGLMEAQSQSIVGLQAQFSDALDSMFNDLGKSQEGAISSTIKAGTAIVQNYDEVIDVLKVLVLTYGSYRAALIATAAVQALPAFINSVRIFRDLAFSIKSAADAQALFSLATGASPLGALLGVVALLGSAYAVYGGKLTEAEQAQERMNEAILDSEKSLNMEIAKVTALREQITDNTKSVDERNKKLKELVALNPKILSAISLQNAATGQSTQTIQEYIRAKKEQIRVDRIQAQIAANLDQVSEIDSGKRDDDFRPSAVDGTGLALASVYGGADLMKKAEEIFKRNKEAAKKQLLDYNKELVNQIGNGIEQRRALRNKEVGDQKVVVKMTAELYDQEIAALKAKQAKEATTRSESRAYDKQIADLERKKRGITGDLSPEEKAAQKAATKLAEDEAKKQVKTYQELLDEKRNLYSLYEKWVQNYGDTAAKDQFAKLIAGGKDYVDYLEREIKRLEDVKNADFLTTQEQFDLSGLVSEKNSILGKKSPLEDFIKDLDNARDSSASLTEELEYLRKKQGEISADDNSTSASGMRQALADRMVEVQRARTQLLQDFLNSVAGSEERETAIRKRFAEARQVLDERTADKKAASYLKALAIINQAEEEDLDNDKTEAHKGLKEYEEFQKLVQKNADDLTKIDVNHAREKFNRLTEGLDKESDLYKQHFQDLIKIENDYNQKRLDNIVSLANAAGQLGQMLSGLDGGLGNIGSLLANTAQQVTTAASAIANLSKKSDKSGGGFDITKITSIVSLITQAIGLVVNGVKKMNDAQRQYDNTVHQFWKGKAMGENEALGDFNENPFYTDYEAMAQAGLRQYEDALNNYNKSIEKLNGGKAVTGFQSGFFRKDSNIYSGLLETYPELVDSAGNLNVALAKTLIETNAVNAATKLWLEDSVAWAEQMEKAAAQLDEVVTSLVGQVGNQLADAMVSGFAAGEDAAQAWGNAVGDIIGDVLKQTVLMKILQPILDRFDAETKESLGKGGDGNIVDDLERLGEYGSGAFEAGYQFMGDYDKWAEANGFGKPFGKDKEPTTSVDPRPMQGMITGASQESISILNGQMNAIRIANVEMVTISRNQLFELTAIKNNTGMTARNTEELHQMRKDMSRIVDLLANDFLRAIGG